MGLVLSFFFPSSAPLRLRVQFSFHIFRGRKGSSIYAPVIAPPRYGTAGRVVGFGVAGDFSITSASRTKIRYCRQVVL